MQGGAAPPTPSGGERKKKKKKLDDMRKRFQAEEKASKLALPTSDATKGSIADLD